MRRAELEVTERVARAVGDVVGDGCVVFAFEADEVVELAAVAHRDRERRERLEALLDDGEAPRGWAAQALAKNLAFRLRHADAAAAVSPAHGIELDISAAVLAPLRAHGAPCG